MYVRMYVCMYVYIYSMRNEGVLDMCFALCFMCIVLPSVADVFMPANSSHVALCQKSSVSAHWWDVGLLSS